MAASDQTLTWTEVSARSVEVPSLCLEVTGPDGRTEALPLGLHTVVVGAGDGADLRVVQLLLGHGQARGLEVGSLHRRANVDQHRIMMERLPIDPPSRVGQGRKQQKDQQKLEQEGHKVPEPGPPARRFPIPNYVRPQGNECHGECSTAVAQQVRRDHDDRRRGGERPKGGPRQPRKRHQRRRPP